MKITVFNEESIQKAITTEKHVVISIQEPNHDCVTLPKLKSRLGCLQLKFHDVDDDCSEDFNNWCKEGNIVPFTPYHAKCILEFVNKWKDDVDVIYVNCVAGIQRSAGVAGALSKILNGDDSYYFKHYIPNRYVYRLILDEYYNEKENNTT